MLPTPSPDPSAASTILPSLSPQSSLDQAELTSRLQHLPRTLSARPKCHLQGCSFPKPVISHLVPKWASPYSGGRQMVCMDREGCAHCPLLVRIFSKARGAGRRQRRKITMWLGGYHHSPPNPEAVCSCISQGQRASWEVCW